MTDDQRDTVETRLWEELAEIRDGMLAVSDAGQHPQPMHAEPDAEARVLRFVTSRDSDLVRAVGQGAQAFFTIERPSAGFYASLHGPITQSTDTDRLAAVWNSVAASWIEGGPEDRDAILLEMPLSDVAIWISEGHGPSFGLEVLRDSLLGGAPDRGLHTHIDFREAA